jgi:hypothetical protein
MKKRIILIIALALVVLLGLYLVFVEDILIRMNSGRVSGVISLEVDGEVVEIDGIDVKAFLGSDVNDNTKLIDGIFNFDKGAYGYYRFYFSLDPNAWDEIGQMLDIEITYFNTYHRATVLFVIRVIVTTGDNSSVEVVASAVREHRTHINYINSQITLINSTNMPISVRIPSP